MLKNESAALVLDRLLHRESKIGRLDKDGYIIRITESIIRKHLGYENKYKNDLNKQIRYLIDKLYPKDGISIVLGYSYKSGVDRDYCFVLSKEGEDYWRLSEELNTALWCDGHCEDEDYIEVSPSLREWKKGIDGFRWEWEW